MTHTPKQHTQTAVSRRSSEKRSLRTRQRRGAVIVLSAFLLIVMVGMLAFTVDLGYMYTMETQLQRSVDSAALAGAGELVNGQEEANNKVVEYLVRNPVGKNAVYTADDELSQKVAEFLSMHEDDVEVTLGHWDPATRSISESNELPSAVKVQMTYANNPLFFSRFLGQQDFSITASSVAMYQPRDIMLVLDLSGSMNDDSEFKSINALGRSAVEDNLLQCYQDLGSPTYGNLTFQPKYAVVQGVPKNTAKRIPHITVEYRRESVYVTSTSKLKQVKLQFDNGYTWSSGDISGRNDKTGRFPDYNTSRRITKVWVKSWRNHNEFGSNGEYFNFYNDLNGTLKEALGLDNVPYPYASGSWDDYIDYCTYNNTQNYSYGGYRYQFGYMNLINYWLEKKPASYQTADLWQVSAQPITAVKNAVDVFMDYVQEVDTDDRVGLAIYDSWDGEGQIEHELTDNLTMVANTARARQAGHYHNNTNIGAGLQEARQQLDANGREGAFKMIILMTDGVANWHNGRGDTRGARNHVLQEAALCGQSKYPIMTISLGAGADTDLMQDAADLSHKGYHFNIPGGQTVEEYSEQLRQVFHTIAGARPLKIVD